MRIDLFTKVVEYVDIIERPLDPETLYIERRGGVDRWMYFSCPCGCGDVLNVCLQFSIIPHWEFEEHEDGTISISPSVLVIRGCKSHFFIKRNKVIWA